MPGLIELYIVILIIFIIESIVLIEENTFLIYSSWFFFKASYKEGIYKWGKKYLKFLNPVLPFSDVFLTDFPIISYSPIGISSIKSNELKIESNQSAGRTFYTYDEIKIIHSEENKIYINDQLFTSCSSDVAAKFTVRFLKELKESDNESIEKKIDVYLNTIFDIKTLNSKYDSFDKSTIYLKVVTQIYWLYLFVILPLLLFKFNYFLIFEPLLFILIALHIITIILVYLTKISVYKKNPHYDFQSNFIKIILSPFAACWSNMILSKDYLTEFHPLVVLKKLIPAKDFVYYGGKIVREYKYCDENFSSNINENEIIKWNREKLDSKIVKFLNDNGDNLQAFILPFSKFNPAAKSFCPRCLAEYTFEDGTCADCEGINLINLNKKCDE